MNAFTCVGSCALREMHLEASKGEGVCAICVNLKMK